MSSLGPLDVAVELGGARRQDEELQSTPLAGGLELAHELTATVDLERPQRKRRAFLQACEEVGSGACSGHRVDFNDIPARNDVTGGEVLEDDSRAGAAGPGVHLHDVPGLTGLIVPGLANGVRSPRPALGGRDGTPGRLEKDPTPFQGRKDASHHRGGDVPAASAQGDDKLVLAPAVLLPQLQDGLGEFATPGGLAAPLGRPRPVFQGAWACLPPAAAPAADRRSWRLQHLAALHARPPLVAQGFPCLAPAPALSPPPPPPRRGGAPPRAPRRGRPRLSCGVNRGASPRSSAPPR